MSSLVSAKGPSITVRVLPSNRTRAPWELEARPSPPSRMPAFSSSSLYWPIAARSSGPGICPASDSFVAFTRTMTLIVVSYFNLLSGRAPVGVAGHHPSFTLSSNENRRDRHSRSFLNQKSRSPNLLVSSELWLDGFHALESAGAIRVRTGDGSPPDVLVLPPRP